jgi:hypothetical protein
MKAEDCKAGCPAGLRSRPSITVNEACRHVDIKGVRVGRVVKVYLFGVKSFDTNVHVSYLRSRDVDVSIERVGFEVSDDRKHYIRGYGPRDMEKDDVAVVFAGGRTPFIIRPSGLESYVVIGDAYMPGLMDGTAFKSVSGDEMKDFRLI